MTFILFAISAGGLLYVSFELLGSWNFLRETYGFTLLVEELTPNIGMLIGLGWDRVCGVADLQQLAAAFLRRVHQAKSA